MNACNEEILVWFTEFFEAFSKVNKLNYKEQLVKFFGSPETCSQYVREPYTKVDDKLVDKWSDLMKIAFEGRSKIKILQDRNDAEHIKKGSILKEQMAETRGGQIIEIGHKVGDKEVAVVFVDTIISGEKGT